MVIVRRPLFVMVAAPAVAQPATAFKFIPSCRAIGNAAYCQERKS